MNANGIAGSAGLAVSGLDRIGYKILYPPNQVPADAPQGTCPRKHCFKTQVFWNPAKKRSKAAAIKVSDLFGQAVVQKLPKLLKSYTNGSMVLVAVGQTFHGTLAPAPIDTVPKKEPPKVTYDANATRSMVLRAQRKVPFKLEVPTLLASGSSPDTEGMPIRTYKIQGDDRAVRLSFAYPSGGYTEYWGVEETNWTDAPVLCRRQLRPHDQGEALPFLLQRPRPAHDRAIRKRRHLLGGEHASRHAVAVDHGRDREGPAAGARGEEVSGSRVAVFGAGYAGLVTGACFAELGHSVAIRDIVPEKIAALNAGELPIFEPGLAELVERNRERLTFTLDAAEAVEGSQFVFICVDTPPTYSGDADLSRVWTAIEELPQTSTRMILVMKSTVPVGTGETIRGEPGRSGAREVGYVSNPEFLAEGTALKDFLEPDRIVVGAFEESDAEAVEGLHAGLDAPIVKHRRRLRGDGQARVECVPRNAHQLHQRDRQRVRARGRGCHESPRHWPRSAIGTRS